MKKVVTLVIGVITLFFLSVPASTSAAEVNDELLTPQEVSKINQALEELKNEANEKLASGDTNFVVSTNTGTQSESISLSFNEEDVAGLQSNRNGLIQPLAVYQEKKYSAEIKNTDGFNFGAKLTGSFTYGYGR